MKLALRALAGAAALAALSAHAEGLYVGGSLGTIRYHGDDIGGLSTDKSSTGGKVWGGWEFTPNFSLEGGYADLGKATSAAGDVKGHGLFLDAVGKVPFTQNLSGIGRVGAFYGRARTSFGDDSGTDVKYGLGLQYDLSKQAAIRGEWERYRFDAIGSTQDVDLYSVGFNYKF